MILGTSKYVTVSNLNLDLDQFRRILRISVSGKHKKLRFLNTTVLFVDSSYYPRVEFRENFRVAHLDIGRQSTEGESMKRLEYLLRELSRIQHCSSIISTISCNLFLQRETMVELLRKYGFVKAALNELRSWRI